MKEIHRTKEFKRLKEDAEKVVPPWRKWGPYVSDRSWGTVREDYSADGEAWSFFPHEDARSRVYRWGEDGIAGFCDRYQNMVFNWAFWNGKDPILKERYFGLTTWEGNHGEDVKEYYYYLDATPTFSYLKFLYKYPMNAFPYQMLYEENKKRGPDELEFELVDTKIFDDDEYFDIYIEYAKDTPDDLCIKIEVFNRSEKDSEIHILPHLFFRNQWSWGDEPKPQPEMSLLENEDFYVIRSDDTRMEPPAKLGMDYHVHERFLYSSKEGKALFTNNETNREKIFQQKNQSPFVKDAFHRKIIDKEDYVVNPENRGTKSCFHHVVPITKKSSKTLYFRLTDKLMNNPFENIEGIFQKRKKEADEYYQALQPKNATIEEKLIQRQAFAGMLWSQQVYLYDVSLWLVGDSKKNPPPDRSKIRNNHWRHLNSMRIMSMPDKWEYPWFAAWDLAFHTTTLAYVDLDFAKTQLWLLLFDQFQHPNGQIPAYEWEFSDVNPPVQAWALLKIFHLEKDLFGSEDFDFVEKCFHKLLLNFAWWVNKIDASGKNVFEGGFLGLDNITVIDRSDRNVEGHLDEADGAGWMAMFCYNLMSIALLLSQRNPIYQSLATKYFEHYIYIAAALRKGYWRDYDMLDNKDYFFYSVLRYKDGGRDYFRVRSLVGIIPLFACGILDEPYIQRFKEFYGNFHWFCQNRTYLVDKCIETVDVDGMKKHVFTLLSSEEMQQFLKYVWDPNEFRSEYGLRSVSKVHEKHPFTYKGKTIGYEPGESLVRIKGGNSNWRGPVWFPTSYLLIDTLRTLSDTLENKVLVNVEGEKPIKIREMTKSFADRLISLFTKNRDGKRPIYGDYEKLQNDPHFQDHILFYEHYHGDTGRGLGASHQTGWSGLVANLIQEFRD